MYTTPTFQWVFLVIIDNNIIIVSISYFFYFWFRKSFMSCNFFRSTNIGTITKDKYQNQKYCSDRLNISFRARIYDNIPEMCSLFMKFLRDFGITRIKIVLANVRHIYVVKKNLKKPIERYDDFISYKRFKVQISSSFLHRRAPRLKFVKM